jgi:cell division protein FtsW (lipid II flippase)
VESIEREKNELRSRMKHIRNLQVLHIIAGVFMLLVLILISPQGSRGPVVAALVVCFFLAVLIIVRLIKLIAEHERTVAKLKILEFFPSTYETYGVDVPDEIIGRMSLDAYKLNGQD